MSAKNREAIPCPTEAQEMRTLCEYLDLHKILYFHAANEGKRSWAAGRAMKAHGGLKKGVPDVWILDRVPRADYRHMVGTVIELKRVRGGTVSAEQKWWLDELHSRGWYTILGLGAKDAIEKLGKAGYGVK